MGLMPVAIGQECDFGKIKWQTREQNNVSAFKRMFLEQVEFAVREYF